MPVDHQLATNFRVEIVGLEGLKGWIGPPAGVGEYVTEVKWINDNHTNVARPVEGVSHFAPFTLYRLFDGNMEFAKWALERSKAKRDGAILFFDYAGEETHRWSWLAGWASSYCPAAKDVEGAEGLKVESVTIVCNDIVLLL